MATHGAGRNDTRSLAERQTGRCLVATALLIALLLVLARPASAAIELRTPTGLHVTIHTATDIIDHWLVERDGRTWLQHPTVGEVELETRELPWSDLVPVSAEVVADALNAMHGFRTDLQIQVFLLPGFPASVLSSYARRDAIFMAPGLARQADETVAYVLTHEMGHVAHWAALDGCPDRWETYRELRRLAPQPDPALVPHAERHREILAEDFRHLFGGPLATVSGTIENGRLPLPDQIQGLESLLVGYLANPSCQPISITPSRVFPNPCRHDAQIEMMVDPAADKTLAGEPILEIYDVRGRLVQRQIGGQLINGRLIVTWDRLGKDGRRVGGGQYLYRVWVANTHSTGKLLVVP